VSLTAMTSYLDFTNSGVLNVLPLGLPDTPFVNKYFAHLFAQEINLTSAARGAWSWSAGTMYRNAKDRTYQTIAGVTPAPLDFQDASESIAVYGEVTRRLFDSRLELTGGLRYFSDTVRTQELHDSFTGVPGTPLVDASSKFHRTTPRVILNYRASDSITTFASYAEGFRSGFQQQPNVILGNPDIPPVRADSLRNYEIGAKGRLLEGRLDFDVAVYYVDWQDVQSDNAVIQFGVPVIALTNGESASGAGFDVSLIARPIHRLQLGVSFSTNRLEYDEAVLAGTQVLFAKGDRLSLSPQYTAGANADYSFPVGGGGYEVALSASANYTSEQYMKFATGFGQADSLLISRASVSLASPSKWTASLYGDNLNNEDGIIQKAPFAVPDWALRPRPRTLGLQVEFRL
jgi:iron complex outermembrane recepter protein